MRSVAKLRLLASEIDNSILKLNDLFHPTKWNTFLEACRLFGNITKDVQQAAPYNIIHVGLTIVNIAKDQKALAPLDEEGKNKREEIQAWIELYSGKFQATVGQHAVKVAREKRWKKVNLLPLAEDVVRLNSYLKAEMDEASSKLKESFSFENFDRLNKATMLHLLIFNRKRVSEVAMLKVSDFKRKSKIQETSDAFKSLDESEKLFARNYFHVLVKGKLHRPVPVLLTKQHASCIEQIIHLRDTAGISNDNPFVFAKGEKFHYNASESMRVAAMECKAKNPKALTTTHLRKHASTVAQTLNLTDNDLRVLSGFLGHTVQTHLEHYRQPSDVLHAARVSKILVALDRGEISKYKGKKIEEIDLEEEEIIEQEEVDITTEDKAQGQSTTVRGKKSLRSSVSAPHQSPLKKRKTLASPQSSPSKRFQSITSPLKKSPKRSPAKRMRIRWSEEEKEIMRKAFANHLRNATLPSFNECYQVKSANTEVLQGRQVQKMKAWVNNENNKIKRLQALDDSDTE